MKLTTKASKLRERKEKARRWSSGLTGLSPRTSLLDDDFINDMKRQLQSGRHNSYSSKRRGSE